MLEIAPDDAAGAGAQRRTARVRTTDTTEALDAPGGVTPGAASRTTGAAAGEHAKARVKQRVRILQSPFTNTTNPYIEMVKRIFAQSGYDVAPMSAHNLLHGGFAHLFSARTVLVFHWLELRPFKRKGGRTLISPLGCLIFLFYCFAIVIGRAKVVYFVHDHAVHDTVGFMRKLSMGLMAMIRRMADARIVHAPTFERTYRAHYLPHPLYWDMPGYEATPRAPLQPQQVPQFAMLGTIRPYKDLAAVLEVWPQQCQLEIAGNGSAEYVQTLHDVIARRALHDTVRIDARFLSDAEFEQRISQTDVLVLPHVADSMLVSGAFFEAIGRVPMLIARATPFMVWAAKKFDNVLLFDRLEQLPELVRYAASTWQSAAQHDKRELATAEFGWHTCCREYQRFFDALVSGEPMQDNDRARY